MRTIAHALLSPGQFDLLSGNLCGDFIKGPIAPEQLQNGFIRGVVLHRRIDAFTDSHPSSLELYKKFPPNLRRFAPVLADFAIDFSISAEWGAFCTVDRTSFSKIVSAHLTECASEQKSGVHRAYIHRILSGPLVTPIYLKDQLQRALAPVFIRFKREELIAPSMSFLYTHTVALRQYSRIILSACEHFLRQWYKEFPYLRSTM